jgi:hypothetical protein
LLLGKVLEAKGKPRREGSVKGGASHFAGGIEVDIAHEPVPAAHG